MAKKRQRQEVEYWDFEFIGTSVSDPAGRIYTGSYVFPNFVKSLDEVSKYVFKMALAAEVLPRRVAIVTHGSVNGFWVGDDYISLDTLEQHSVSFQRLSRVMIQGIATLELYSCQVGKNTTLIRRISEMLGGVVVAAYEENQPASGESKGKTIKCKLNECKKVAPKKRSRQRGSSRPFGVK